MRPIEQVVYIRGSAPDKTQEPNNEKRSMHKAGTNRYYVNFPETWKTLAGRRLTIGVRAITYHTGYPAPVTHETSTVTDIQNDIEYYNYGFSWNVCFMNKYGYIIPESKEHPFIYDVRYGFRFNKYSPTGWLEMKRYGLQTQLSAQREKWNAWLRQHGAEDIDDFVGEFEWHLSTFQDYHSLSLAPVNGEDYTGVIPIFYNYFDYNWDKDWKARYFPMTNFAELMILQEELTLDGRVAYLPRIEFYGSPVPSKERSHVTRIPTLTIPPPAQLPNSSKTITFSAFTGIPDIRKIFDELVTAWNNMTREWTAELESIGKPGLATYEWELVDRTTTPELADEFPEYPVMMGLIRTDNRDGFSRLNWSDLAFQRFMFWGIPSSWYQLYIDSYHETVLIGFTEAALRNPWYEDSDYDLMNNETYYLPSPTLDPEPTATPVPTITTGKSTALAIYEGPTTVAKYGNFYPALLSLVLQQFAGIANFADHYYLTMRDAIYNNNPTMLVKRATRKKPLNKETHSLKSNVTFKNATGIPFGQCPVEIRYTRNPWTEEFDGDALATQAGQIINGTVSRMQKVASKENEDAPATLNVTIEKTDEKYQLLIEPEVTPISGSYPDFEDFGLQINETDTPLRNVTVTNRTYTHQNGHDVLLPVITFEKPLAPGVVETNTSVGLGVQHNDSLEVQVTQPAEISPLPNSETSATITKSEEQVIVEQNPIPSADTSATVRKSWGSKVISSVSNWFDKTTAKSARKAAQETDWERAMERASWYRHSASKPISIAPQEPSRRLMLRASFVSQTLDNYLGFTNSEYCPMKTYDITAGDDSFWVDLHTADGNFEYELDSDGSEFITIELQLCASV